MVIDPVTLAIIAEGINLGVQAIGSAKNRKIEKKSRKENRKQTESDLLNASLEQGVENEEKSLKSSRKLGKGRAQALRNTAATVRGALL
jgi:hypothetical protein